VTRPICSNSEVISISISISGFATMFNLTAKDAVAQCRLTSSVYDLVIGISAYLGYPSMTTLLR